MGACHGLPVPSHALRCVTPDHPLPATTTTMLRKAARLQGSTFCDHPTLTPHCKSCFFQLFILPSTLSSGFYVADGSWTHWCTCLLMSASLSSGLPQQPVGSILHNSFLCGSTCIRTTAAMTVCGSDKEVVCNSAFHEQTLKLSRFPEPEASVPN